MNDNKQVSLYDFKGHQVRVVEIEGNPWFVAADVCVALGLGGYPSGHTIALPANEKMVLSRSSNSRLAEDQRSYIRRVDVGLNPGRDPSPIRLPRFPLPG